MTSSLETLSIVADIIEVGLLRARAAGWSGDAERCALEADHIHNLPRLIHEFSPDLLRHYWDNERPAYVSACSAEDLEQWEPLWRRLRDHVEAFPRPTTTRSA